MKRNKQWGFPVSNIVHVGCGIVGKEDHELSLEHAEVVMSQGDPTNVYTPGAHKRSFS